MNTKFWLVAALLSVALGLALFLTTDLGSLLVFVGYGLAMGIAFKKLYRTHDTGQRR